MATLQELENGLRKAHAAGNADHARAFAAEIRRMREQPTQAPDFSGVSASVDTTATGPQQAVPDGSIGRTLGLGARAMMEGAYSVPGIVLDPVMQAIGQPASREAAGAHADMLGLPSPANAVERVSGDITGALTGGGGFMGAGRALASGASGVAQRVGQVMASHPGAQVASVAAGSGAAGATREAGGGTGAQLASGLAAGLAPSAGIATLQAGVRGAVRGGEAGRQAMERGIQDFQAVGASPSVGQASGNWRTQGLESLLAGGPTSSGAMSRFAERQADDIGTGLRQLADDFMPNASAERAGRAIERGAELFGRNTSATKRALYWEADRLIPDTTRVPMSNTQRALQELTALTPGAESTTAQLVNPKIATLARTVGEDLFAAQATGAGGVPYSAVKEIRSRIGQELSDYSLTTDKPTAEYKRLYAALSRDMEEAARAQGPEAERAARRANNYTRAAADRLEQVQRVIDRNGGPERVFTAAMSGTKDGGTTLRAVMQSLPKEGQRAVTAAVIKRMGLANAGAQDAAGESFNANTFLTNWNRISPEARRTLFDRHGPGFTRNMDKIARVADRIREGSRVFANPSGTANRAAAIGYYGSLPATGLIAGPGPLAIQALGGIGANAAARALTNPRVVGWLAKTTELPVSSLPQQVNGLRSIARDEGDEDLLAWANLLSQQQPEKRNDARDGAAD